MATKKTTDEAFDTAVAELDPWEKVELRTERGLATDDPNEFVSINGVNYLIPKGKTSMVPRCVADEYRRMMDAKDAFYEKIDSILASQPKDL